MMNGTELLICFFLKILVNKVAQEKVIGHSRGGASTKIHAVVDSYGNPLYLMISEGQRNDTTYAVPLLE